MIAKCIQKYGKPQRACRFPAKWYFRNPATKELEGPYCGHHAKQFKPNGLRPLEFGPARDVCDGEKGEQ